VEPEDVLYKRFPVHSHLVLAILVNIILPCSAPRNELDAKKKRIQLRSPPPSVVDAARIDVISPER
jgi:hypothetical protein